MSLPHPHPRPSHAVAGLASADDHGGLGTPTLASGTEPFAPVL